jgi:hypothetical protein
MFRGAAEIVPFDHPEGQWAMSQSRIGRMNLNTESEDPQSEYAFIKITPEPTVFCYGLGHSIMEMRGDHTNMGYKVTIPEDRQ